jgi:hypothetical protein
MHQDTACRQPRGGTCACERPVRSVLAARAQARTRSIQNCAALNVYGACPSHGHRQDRPLSELCCWSRRACMGHYALDGILRRHAATPAPCHTRRRRRGTGRSRYWAVAAACAPPPPPTRQQPNSTHAATFVGVRHRTAILHGHACKLGASFHASAATVSFFVSCTCRSMLGTPPHTGPPPSPHRPELSSSATPHNSKTRHGKTGPGQQAPQPVQG